MKLSESLGGTTECFSTRSASSTSSRSWTSPTTPAAALSLAVTSSGRVKSLRTHRLIDADESQDMFARAKKAVGAYEVPGG